MESLYGFLQAEQSPIHVGIVFPRHWWNLRRSPA